MYLLTCVSSEDTDQPAHTHSLIRVFSPLRNLKIFGYRHRRSSLRYIFSQSSGNITQRLLTTFAFSILTSCLMICSSASVSFPTDVELVRWWTIPVLYTISAIQITVHTCRNIHHFKIIPILFSLTLVLLNLVSPAFANSVDPDQLAWEANWSRSELFVIQDVNLSHDRHVIQWNNPCHKNHITTRVITPARLPIG